MRPAAVTLVVALVCMACRPAAEPPVCGPQELARIEAEYLQEALAECADAGSPEACAELPAIEAKYSARRTEWVTCR